MLQPSVAMFLLLALALMSDCSGHHTTFTRCQLSRELLRYNFPRSLIPNWVCLIEHGSGRTTTKVSNYTSFTNYGLFQISDKEWCKKGRNGGYCNMKCEDLLNADLADDVRCAKRVFDRIGFGAWPTAYSYCQDKSLPDLSRC